MTTYPDLLISYLGYDMKLLCLILKLQNTSVGGIGFLIKRKSPETSGLEISSNNISKKTIAMIKEIDDVLQNFISNQIMDL